MKLGLNCGAARGWFAGVATAVVIAGAASADVLYSQPPSTSGAVLTSAYWDPDGSNYDEYVWDGFLLPAAGNVTEIRWRGAYPGGGAGGGNITDFEVSIYASIPAGTQPDLGYQYPGPLVHYMTGSNAGETYAGNVGGTNMYDYHFVLPRPFAAVANTRYWVQIIAWQPGWPTWGLAIGSGGNGSHFGRVPAVTGDYRFVIGSSDAAFSLIGTMTACTNPVITQGPTPVSVCYGGASVTLSVSATSGSGAMSYQWRRNGSPVYDGPNGGGLGGGSTISGAQTATLTIAQPSYWAQPGVYECAVSNTCGVTVSGGAQLDVTFGVPGISTQPASVATCPRGAAALSVVASGTVGGYQWQVEQPAGTGMFADLTDGVVAGVGAVSGTSTTNLAVTAPAVGVNIFRCLVSNVCGSVASGTASVSVCAADYNCSGTVSVQDIFDFLAGYFASDPAADINGSGAVSVQDIFDFLALYFAGCA